MRKRVKKRHSNLIPEAGRVNSDTTRLQNSCEPMQDIAIVSKKNNLLCFYYFASIIYHIIIYLE